MRIPPFSANLTRPKMNPSKPSAVPDSLLEILETRVRYEEGKIDEIKAAYDADDRDLVFRLVRQLLYEGPGTIADKAPK
jgi:hypothetical protein